MVCYKCNLGKNFSSSRISYQILNYPKFLFILFDNSSYNQLLNNKELVRKLYIEYLNFTETDKYILKGCVTSPSYNHFTFFINKIKIKDIIDELELNNNYYYDDVQFNGYFQTFKNNNIYELLTKNIIPYLLIYEKIQ